MKKTNETVSVPYRGYSFFNTDFTEQASIALIEWVSVPYRGYSFFNPLHEKKF